MIFGMPSLIECPDAKSNALLCKRLGLQFVEFNMNLPMFQAGCLEEVAEEVDRHGVGMTLHLDENFNPADFNDRIADAHLETLREALRAAKRFNVPIVNMHLAKGVYFTLPEGKVYLFEQYRDRYFDRICALRALCEEEIGAGDLRVCVENGGRFQGLQRETLDFLLKSPVFALTWDIGHSYKAILNAVPFPSEYLSRLTHFHIHDVRDHQDHQVLGTGEVNLKERLNDAQAANARCVVETKTIRALEASVAWLQGNGWMSIQKT